MLVVVEFITTRQLTHLLFIVQVLKLSQDKSAQTGRSYNDSPQTRHVPTIIKIQYPKCLIPPAEFPFNMYTVELSKLLIHDSQLKLIRAENNSSMSQNMNNALTK